MECRRDKAQTDEELESKRGLLGMGMACPLWTTRWEGQVLSPASPSISAFGRSVYNRI